VIYKLEFRRDVDQPHPSFTVTAARNHPFSSNLTARMVNPGAGHGAPKDLDRNLPRQRTAPTDVPNFLTFTDLQ
jgi:hypothetical protein